MTQIIDPLKRDRRARLRFSIIGALLAAPPAPSELQGALSSLAAKVWRDPASGLDVLLAVEIRVNLAADTRKYSLSRKWFNPSA